MLSLRDVSRQDYDKWLKGVQYCTKLKEGLQSIVKQCLRIVTANIRKDLLETRKLYHEGQIQRWKCTANCLPDDNSYLCRDHTNCKLRWIYQVVKTYVADTDPASVLRLCTTDLVQEPEIVVNELEVAKLFMATANFMEVKFLSDLNQVTLDQLISFLVHCKIELKAPQEISRVANRVQQITKVLHESAITMQIEQSPLYDYDNAALEIQALCNALLLHFVTDEHKKLRRTVQEMSAEIQKIPDMRFTSNNRTEEIQTAYSYKISHYEAKLNYWIGSSTEEAMSYAATTEITRILTDLKLTMERDCENLRRLVLQETGIDPLTEVKETLVDKINSTDKILNSFDFDTDAKNLRDSIEKITKSIAKLNSSIDVVKESSTTKLNLKVNDDFRKINIVRDRRETLLKLKDSVDRVKEKYDAVLEAGKTANKLEAKLKEFKEQVRKLKENVGKFADNVAVVCNVTDLKEESYSQHLHRQLDFLLGVIGITKMTEGTHKAWMELAATVDSLPRRFCVIQTQVKQIYQKYGTQP